MHALPSLRASGTAGEIRVGYQVAAHLGQWSLTLLQRVPRTFQLRARITSTHDYWSRQQPQDLVLWLGLTAWRWNSVAMTLTGDSVVVDLIDRPMVEAAIVALEGTHGK